MCAVTLRGSAVRPVARRTAASFFESIRCVFMRPLFVAASLLLVMGLAHTAQAQISPGRLASPHHNLEGPTNCTKCHTQSVRALLFAAPNATARSRRNSSSTAACTAPTQCRASPARRAPSAIRTTTGKTSECCTGTRPRKGSITPRRGTCWTGNTQRRLAARVTRQRIFPLRRAACCTKGSEPYLHGAETQCTTCHEDHHKGRFGTTCTTCHNTTDWKDAKVEEKGFDHSKTNYPLTGRHQEVACQKCHTAGADGRPRYAASPSDLRHLPRRPAQGRIQAGLRIVPHHVYLEDRASSRNSITPKRPIRCWASTRR